MCFLLEYENLTRDYDKSKSVIEKEGIPNFYVKCLADLEDYIQKVIVQFLALGSTRRNNQVVCQMSCRPLRLYIKGNYSVFEALFFCSVPTWLICHHCFETTFCRISFFCVYYSEIGYPLFDFWEMDLLHPNLGFAIAQYYF